MAIAGHLLFNGLADSKDATNGHEKFKDHIHVYYAKLEFLNSHNAHLTANIGGAGSTGIQGRDLTLGIGIGPSNPPILGALFDRTFIPGATLFLQRGRKPNEKEAVKGNEISFYKFDFKQIVVTRVSMEITTAQSNLPDILEISLAATEITLEAADFTGAKTTTHWDWHKNTK